MKWIFATSVMLLLMVMFFWPLVSGEKLLYCCDNLTITIPTRLYLVEELRAGRFPVDNPYLFSGSKFFADLNLTTLAPSNLFYFILSPFRALTVSQLIWFWIFGFGMLKLSRVSGLTAGAGLVASVATSFSGVLITYLDNAPHLQAAGMAPWVIASWVMISQKHEKRRIVWLIILISLQVVVGHPQITFYTGLIGVAYYLLFGKTDLIGKIRGIGVIGCAVLILTSIQVVPFIQLARESTRVGRGWEYATFGSLTPVNIVRLFIPSLVGGRADGTAWAQEGSVFGYVSVVVLVLSLSIARLGLRWKFWQLAAAITFLLALGKYSPVYWLAYFLLPGVGQFRVPAHFMFIYTIAVSLVAARVIDGKLGKLGRWGRVVLVTAIGGYILVILGGIVGEEFAEKLEFLGTRGMITISRNIVSSSIFYILSLGGIWWLRNYRRALITWLILVIVLDAFLYLRPNILTVGAEAPIKWESMARETVNRLPDFQMGERLYVAPSAYAAPRVKIFGLANIEEEAAWAYKILRPNINMYWKVGIPDGYSAIVNRDYAKKIGDKSNDPTGVKFDSENRQRLFELGVRAIIAAEDDELIRGMREIGKIGEKKGMGIYVK